MRPLVPALLVALALVLPLVLPGAALACSVCGTADEEARGAFLFTTLLLSVLPPALVGGTAWWVWRRARQREGAAGAIRRAAEAPAAHETPLPEGLGADPRS